nr:MAG TPA: hypothetical protein [Caudoviricetes sp.]
MTTHLKCKVNLVKNPGYQEQAISFFNTVRDSVFSDTNTMLKFIITDKVSIHSFLEDQGIKGAIVAQTGIKEILNTINDFIHAALAKSFPRLFAAAKGRWMVNSILAKMLLARTMLDPDAHYELLQKVFAIASLVFESIVFQKEELTLYYALKNPNPLDSSSFDFRIANYSCLEIPILEETTPKVKVKYNVKILTYLMPIKDKIASQDHSLFESLFNINQPSVPTYVDHILDLIRTTILDGFSSLQDPYIVSLMEIVRSGLYAKEAKFEYDAKENKVLAEYLYFLYQNRNLSALANERFTLVSTYVFSILQASNIGLSRISDAIVRFSIEYSGIQYSILFNNTTGRKLN